VTETGVEDIYQAVIMDRARHPRHQGRLAAFDAEATEANPLCGDRVTLQLRRDGQGRIAALGYHARACAICLAATDLMAEIVPGMTAAAARETAARFEAGLRGGGAMTEGSVPATLQPFAPLRDVPSRIGCATLGWRALVAALTSHAEG
jgi:nitrogen fixation protein NifU and related proteins